MEFFPTNILFHVLGTSSKVYKVIFQDDKTISCSCADFTYRKKTCKHCFFIMDKIIINTNVPLKMIIRNISLTSRMNIDESLKHHYEDLLQQLPDRSSARNTDCCVCLELLDVSPMICSVCKNGIHEECYKKWVSVNSKLCVYCRSKFVQSKNSSEKKVDDLGNVIL